MARPSKETLEYFSALAELNEENRKRALAGLLDQQSLVSDPEQSKYCFERLISGLASTRAAARLGFSTSLLMFLSSELGNEWPVGKLIAIADKKMDLSDKTLASSNAIGHYLLICAIVTSKKAQGEDIPVLIEQMKKVKDSAPVLSFAVTKIFADLCLSLTEKQLVKYALSFVEIILESVNMAFTPENVSFALTLRKKFPQVVAKIVKFVGKDGKCNFTDENYPKLLQAIKRCDHSNQEVFNELLLESSAESGNFEKLYTGVFEPWALASSETKVLERIFGVVQSFFDNEKADSKLIVSIFTKELLSRMEMAMRGKGQFRLLRDAVSKFGTFVKSKLESLKGEDAYQALTKLKQQGNVDRACGISLTTSLLANLDKKNVKTWIKDNINSQEELRKIVVAFSSWDEQSRIAVLETLLSQKSTETIQIVVTSIVDSLFYVKTRAGEFASIQLSEHNEQILRQLVVTASGKGGEEEVKKAEKKLAKSTERTKSLHILWLVTRLWAAVAPSAEESEPYLADSDELIAIAANEKDKNNSKVFIDLLIGILSREKKFHRTPVAFAFAHALPTLKSKDLISIVETAMLSEKELVEDDDEDVEDEEGMPFDEADIPKKSGDDEDLSGSDDEDNDEEEEDVDESVDQELLDKLNVALGDAAAREDNSDQEMDDLNEEEMRKMDERLAAAFKMMGPKGFGRKQTTKNVEALKMKIADILLIAISSKDVSEKNKIKLIIPILKWAKSDLKLHDKVAQRAIELINVILRLKITDVKEKETILLMQQVIEESANVTNIFVVDIVARVIAFVLKVSSPDGLSISEGVRAEFLKLFEEFFKNVEGKVPTDFVIKPIVVQPRLFVNDLKMLIDAGFDEKNRIFKRTEALNAVSVICTKTVLKDVNLEKSVVKSFAKHAGNYLEKVVEEDSSEIKPRFFATVLRILFNISAPINDDEKLIKIMNDGLEATIRKMSSGDTLAKLKKMNSACQQVVGKSFQGAIAQIKKNLEITDNN